MKRRDFLGLTLGVGAAFGGGQQLFSAWAAEKGSKPGFFFRDGDRVVMIGDSITEQHQHSNFVEIYTLSRFPNWKLAFRNVGIGGDTSTGGNGRAQRDVLSFRPTAVTITFGMNDAGYKYPYDPARMEAYRTGLQGMADQLKAAHARVAILSSSPVEKAEDGPAMQGYNQTLEAFAGTAQQVAQKNGFQYVDQFHPHVQTLQKSRDAKASNRINGGDAVHPGPSGQLLMTWAILKGLGAPALVSSAEVNARSGKAGKHENCTVSAVKKEPKGVSFTRADNALPFWIPHSAWPILQWAPIEQDLDQYLLRVTGLPEGNYTIRIDGQPSGSASAAELATGFNMALLTTGPIAKQAEAVYEAVFAKNSYYHDQIFRGVVLNRKVAEADKAAMIEERMKGMPKLEQAIRDALVLKPHRFEISPGNLF